MARFVVTADWDNNAPHLSAEQREALWGSIPTYQKDARGRGIPQLGAGVIFPVPDDDLLVAPFKIPDHWPRGYGLDVGWQRTAATWRALDVDSDPPISYIYDEYYMATETPEVNAVAIRRRGLWIPGRIDPAARGRNQKDGTRLLSQYRVAIYGAEDLALGVQMLGIANNSVESGLYDLLMAMQAGTFKVFRGRAPNFMAERRLYRRDEHGRVVKKNDHALDATRYGKASGDTWLATKPAPEVVNTLERFADSSGDERLSWMGS